MDFFLHRNMKLLQNFRKNILFFHCFIYSLIKFSYLVKLHFLPLFMKERGKNQDFHIQLNAKAYIRFRIHLIMWSNEESLIWSMLKLMVFKEILCKLFCIIFCFFSYSLYYKFPFVQCDKYLAVLRIFQLRYLLALKRSIYNIYPETNQNVLYIR